AAAEAACMRRVSWRYFARLVFLCTAGAARLYAASAAAEAGPLGAPGFHPTVEHPFGWRGDGGGRFVGATPVTEWSTTKNVRWSTEVGSSYSSPILTEQAVIVTS